MKKAVWLMLIIVFCLVAPGVILAQDAQEAITTEAESQAVVQAVLFYSPTCPHCHQVINEDLPPLNEKYGDRLQILGVDVTQPLGQELYQNAITHFEVADDRLGVPAMVIGDSYLVGSLEIPQVFPQLVAEGMATGGIGWPEIPGLREAVPDLPPSAAPGVEVDVTEETAVMDTAAPEEILAETEGGLTLEEINTTTLAAEVTPPPDPAGFAVAWLVMAGMWLALAYTAWRFWRVRAEAGMGVLAETAVSPLNNSLIPILVLVGLIVALYLSYVEMTHVEAVCGPIGECNIVQSSSYAQLLGIPVAILGVINYLAVGGLWLWQRADPQSQLPAIILPPLTVLGTLFSIYLTTLELFAIQAVCAWCLTSAVVTTFLMVIVVSAVTKRPSSRPLELA